MLEQYSDHPQARQKIVLVSPGYVATEILKLGLIETEWPSVFAHRRPPPEAIMKNEKEQKKLIQQRARLQRSASTPSVRSESDASNVTPTLLDMVNTWNAKVAVNRASQGVGLGASRGTPARLASLDLAEIQESNDEVD